MKLHSKRLLKIAECIKTHRKGRILADIGTDHALLPCYMVDQNIVDLAYACDIAQGPLNSSKATITANHMEDRVIPLLGDGLDPITNCDVDMIAICGMGGILMCDILDAHLELLSGKRLFLQANTAIDVLRAYLSTHHLAIIDEMMVKDSRHIYETMVVDTGEQTLSEEDQLFGPILRHKKEPLFIEKWQRELGIQNRILETLLPAHDKYASVIHYKQLIEQALDIPQ